MRRARLCLFVVFCACGSSDRSSPEVEQPGALVDAAPETRVPEDAISVHSDRRGDAGIVSREANEDGARASDTGVSARDAQGAGEPGRDGGGAPWRDGGDALTDAARDAAVDPPRTPPGSPATWSLCPTLAARAGLTLPSGGPVSWAQLLCDTVDLDRFTRPPAQAYKALMASSYNRASKEEGKQGWFANDDAGHYLRDDGDEHVMMEQEGPGVITRIWSANPTGRIRIYIDDAQAPPVIDVPMADFLSGKFEAPWGEPLVFVAVSGSSAYLPIPYSSYVRVSTTTDEKLYYQVESRAYPAGTQVEPFSLPGLRALAALSGVLAKFLANPSADEMVTGLPVHMLTLSADAPEQRVSLGPAVVRELTITGFEPTQDKLRKTRLTLSVDGEQVVDAPLGDLFGSGPGIRPFDSLAASMSASTLTLRWPMPVRGELVARVAANDAPLANLNVALRYSVGIPDDARLFHARWTGVQELSARDPVDWSVLEVAGEGWYVGTVLNVENPTNAWWGEGDEKIFVDGESFPSHFGTGTEDYFGFAWCSTELAARPWLGQTRADGPGNAGRSSMYRWHLGDAIPFRSALRFRLETLTWLENLIAVKLTQDAVAYWYAAPGSTVAQPELTLSDYRVPTVTRITIPALPGTSTCRL